ncbi:MAG: YibE/F family protein [Synergistaceae bacterium]|nr:YibE/F family protein [Synergistaceae bacterium]
MSGPSPWRRAGALTLRSVLSLAVAATLYVAVDRWAIRVWDTEESFIARVSELGPEAHVRDESGERFPMLQREVTARILTGDRRGQDERFSVVRLEGSGIDPIPGRRYLVVEDTFEDGTVQRSIADAYRVPSIVALIVAFALMLISLTGWAGFRAIVGLCVSVAVLLWGMVPLMTRGWPPVPISLAAVVVISTVTVLCVAPCARDRTAALLGSIGGVGCGFVMGGLMVQVWQLTGLAGEGAALLASTLPGIDMRGVLMAAILVGSIGAVLDVGVSVTAAMAELVGYDPDVPLRRLWSAGLTVGSEVLGSMINTLILAYLGAALPMAILIAGAGADMLGILNDPYIGQEIVQSLAGTAGLLSTIPVTAAAFVAQEAWIRRGRPEPWDEDEETQG